MWKTIAICLLVATIAVAVNNKRYASYSTGYAPGFNFIDPFEFHQRLTNQIYAQQSAQNQVSAAIYTSEDASANAAAATYTGHNDELFRDQFAHQQALFDSIRRQSLAGVGYAGTGGYAGSSTGGYAGAGSYSSAGGSYGPGGYYQSASIYPENVNQPNIVSRFSESSGGPGYKGVSVSSYSHSADVNGKRASHRGATTTFNDNGKITSYQVHS